MRRLTERVKNKSLKKWSFRAKDIEEAEKWWRRSGERECSFCDHFHGERHTCEASCPFSDDSSEICCREYGEVIYTIEYNNSTVEEFNAACQAVYDRIDSLPVGKGKGEL